MVLREKIIQLEAYSSGSEIEVYGDDLVCFSHLLRGYLYFSLALHLNVRCLMFC